MPSWNETPHTIPTINVNLATCSCGYQRWLAGGAGPTTCVCEPVLIPCPIPRSAMFGGLLGECTCADEAEPGNNPPHLNGCPARLVKVYCSISGKTWEGSDVTDVALVPASRQGPWADEVANEERASFCRDRWALIKALVLGRSPTTSERAGLLMAAHYNGMIGTRDAVYAALSDMARAERAGHAAFLALPMDVRKSSIIAKACGHVAADPEQDAEWPSRAILAHYVERLVEQVSAFGAEP